MSVLRREAETGWIIGEAQVVENALILAAARRLMRPNDSAPLGTIRSLAYFLPVIDEVLGLHVNPDYFRYLRQKIERTSQTR